MACGFDFVQPGPSGAPALDPVGLQQGPLPSMHRWPTVASGFFLSVFRYPWERTFLCLITGHNDVCLPLFVGCVCQVVLKFSQFNGFGEVVDQIFNQNLCEAGSILDADKRFGGDE